MPKQAYYLPETEYVHWARSHPVCEMLHNDYSYIIAISPLIYSQRFPFPLQEYTRNQITGLINLVATMKGWKRKTRLEVLEKIEAVTV